MPVIVQGKAADKTTFADPTRAIILSAHGCLITLSVSVSLGERLMGGRTEVGLGFKTAAPQFWGLDHPPPDWK